MASAKRLTYLTQGKQSLDAEERRSICRYEVVQTQAWLGWWKDRIDFQSTSACIVDISLRGCMMTVDLLPPKDQPVWFCAPGTTPSEWLEARLVESKRRLFGPRVVRIEFDAPFRYEAFKHLVYGPDALSKQNQEPEPVPESQRNYW